MYQVPQKRTPAEVPGETFIGWGDTRHPGSLQPTFVRRTTKVAELRSICMQDFHIER